MGRIPFLLASLLAAPAVTPPREPPTTWYLIATEDGTPIGHSSQQIIEGPNGRDFVSESRTEIQELASPVTRNVQRTIVRQDRAGRTLSISLQSGDDRRSARTEIRIVGDRAEIVRESGRGRHSEIVPLPPRVRFDDGGALLAGWNPDAMPRLEFDNFSLATFAVEHVVIERAPGAASAPDGGMVALRSRFDNGELRSISRLHLDAGRRIVSIVQPMFGFAITTSVSDRDTALRSHPPFHALRAVMVRAPFRIQTSAMEGHIRFRFGFVDEIQFALPQTGEQKVTNSPGEALVDICDDCGPGLSHDPATLAAALRPNEWMQSDDPRIRAIARPIARLAVADRRKMELLIQAARPYLERTDFTGHYSAVETLERRAGDCTEASVLLGALGRAAGIPTRVVNGLVYARGWYHGTSNVFMPHSWTLAYVDGAWRSFDLAIDEFDATHIALTVGDGDARSVQAASQLASLLRWNSMLEVRPRPAA